jgi:acyl-CoA synthetase (AMP-forming)/AMP-acid ligase II
MAREKSPFWIAYTIRWVVSYTACHILGAVPVFVNSTLTTDSIIHCLAITNPELTLVDLDMAKVLGPLRHVLRTKKVGDVHAWSPSWATDKLPANVRAGLSYVKDESPSAGAMRAVIEGVGIGLENLNHDSDGTIFFTSGTTGYPKAVLSDQRGALHNTIAGGVAAARSVLRNGGSTDDIVFFPAKQPVVLLAVPMFHVTGCMSWITRGWTQRFKFVFTRRWNLPDVMKLIKDENINVSETRTCPRGGPCVRVHTLTG